MRGALASARRLVPFRGRAALQHLADIEDAGLSAEGEAPIGQDLRENFYVATRDNFRTQTLTEVMLEVGADRMLYSVDYPFEDMALAANFGSITPPSAIQTAQKPPAATRGSCADSNRHD